MPPTTQINIRRDTAANFTSANPTLALGEIAYETDTFRFKVGTGSTAWTSLGYAAQNPTSLTVNGAATFKGGITSVPKPSVDVFTTAIGLNAGAALTTGSSHTLIGWGAGDSITNASNSVAVGFNALTSGNIDNAVAIGTSALNLATTGNGTVAVGFSAGRYAGTTASNMTSGANSIFIGYQAKAAADSQTNQIVIGHDAVGSGSNTTTIGNSSTTDTIIPAGRLGVGATTLPDAPIHATGSSASTSAYNVGSQIAVLTNTNATNNNWTNISFTDEDGGAAAGVFGLQHLDHANKHGRFLLATRSSGGLTEKLTVESAGDVKITTGNLVIGTAGKGIDFSADGHATGMTSELLDDYEEGTWTPVYEPSGGSFAAITMDVTGAFYTKIGRSVTVTGRIQTDNLDTTGASGFIRIAGLPFTSATNNYSAAYMSDVGAFAGDAPSSGSIGSAATTIILQYRSAANGGSINLAPSDMTTGVTANQNVIYLVAHYFTA